MRSLYLASIPAVGNPTPELMEGDGQARRPGIKAGRMSTAGVDAGCRPRQVRIADGSLDLRSGRIAHRLHQFPASGFPNGRDY